MVLIFVAQNLPRYSNEPLKKADFAAVEGVDNVSHPGRRTLISAKAEEVCFRVRGLDTT